MVHINTQYSEYQRYLESVISVLVTKLAPEGIKLTNEEIEDAPDIEVRNLFETDEIEFRASTYGK